MSAPIDTFVANPFFAFGPFVGKFLEVLKLKQLKSRWTIFRLFVSTVGSVYTYKFLVYGVPKGVPTARFWDQNIGKKYRKRQCD